MGQRRRRLEAPRDVYGTPPPLSARVAVRRGALDYALKQPASAHAPAKRRHDSHLAEHGLFGRGFARGGVRVRTRYVCRRYDDRVSLVCEHELCHVLVIIVSRICQRLLVMPESC